MSYSNNNDQWGSSFGSNTPASNSYQAKPGAVPVIDQANQPNPGKTTPPIQ